MKPLFIDIALVVLTIASLVVIFFLVRKRVKDFVRPSWRERLESIQIDMKKEMREMYILSVTYGMCEIGELFGNLLEVQKILDKEEFAKVAKFHEKFQEAVASMYALTFQRKQLKVTEERVKELYEQARTAALYNYHRLIEIKRENNIGWNDPLAAGLLYPVV